jgi:hypothetical protein
MGSINYHYQKACKLASKRVEQMARTILRNHPHLDEFIMANGSYFFTIKNSDDHISATTQKMNSSWDYYYVDTFAYLKPLNNFIGKWTDYLKITGDPMRFTATGKKITDW